MIKFFRKIRKKLLTENKFSKYLIYAFGEIILVVIGILIALSINNWNEAKKDRDYEVKMLSEIEKGLRLDLSNLHEHYEGYTTLKKTVDHFSKLTNDHVIFADSMLSDLWKLNWGKYLQFNRGPYDALKSSGIDRVSNDSIRNQLINFFDFSLLEFQSEIDHTTRRYRSNVDLLLSFREAPFLDEYNNWVVNRVPEDILQKPKFVWLLSDIDYRVWSSKSAIETFTPRIEELIQSVKNEIDNN
ncbi:MAG: hypothetical protein GQ574_24945 [Crocinitomix sp.]|nr:hypothetical protein [Crocinitomix sp.]